MRYITQGMVKPEKFDILFRLAGFKSDSVIEALRDYLVKGYAPSVASDLNGVQRSNFSRDYKKLNTVAADVERCKEIDLAVLRD